jgi:hypothetical protein
MDLLEQAVECVQDDGDTHGCLVWAQELHVRACTAGDPDPTALAQRLFTRATTDEWGVFANVVADYADVLGPAGVATLRGLITEELQQLPRLDAGAKADLHHSRIPGLAERAAKAAHQGIHLARAQGSFRPGQRFPLGGRCSGRLGGGTPRWLR